MPESMRAKFPNVHVIIDCAEFEVETPSSLTLHKMMYSQYKHHTTVKSLLGIMPGGGFTFISPVFPGDTSDKEMVQKSGLLTPNLWNRGDGLMADRGFTVHDYVNELGVELILSSFHCKRISEANK